MSKPSGNTTYTDRIADALVAAVDQGRIGLPRFVRWLDGVGVGDSLPERLAVGIDTCSRVFGGAPSRQHQSGDGRRHATMQAVWASGASALISAGPAKSDTERNPEIMLLGSSGAVYFDGTSGGVSTVAQVVDR